MSDASQPVPPLQVVPPPDPDPQPVADPAEVAPKPAKKTPGKTTPKWEAEARDKLKAFTRKIGKPLADLIARDANEGDTRLLVTDMLCYGLGYDKYEDLTTEYQVKGEFADYGVRIEQQLVAFIEVKRCTTKLGEKHLRQVQMYAVNEGVEWMILTNGAVWQVYHLTGGLPVVTTLAFEVDLTSDDTTLGQKVDKLFYISRESFKRRQIDDLWKEAQATSPASLVAAIESDAVLDAIRKELKRVTGHRPEVKDIRAALRETVIRPECLEA